ncbi:MAG TPA: hypothetical protein PLO61_06935 [Fimbriimonadaceae bacterium]|nr:hypothetical protein [Fimbriimonadaceae bacterium]HRJ33257.1 hypothetical protein [Fimbriimonadaceae bacterium]
MNGKVLFGLVSLACILATGCQKRSIVGSWKMDSKAPLETIVEFRSDRSLTGQVQVMGFAATMDANWEIQADQVTLSRPNFREVPESVLKMLPSGLVGASTYQIEWLGDGRIKLSGPGFLSGTYRRHAGSPDASASPARP